MKSTVKSIIASASCLALAGALFGCAPQPQEQDQPEPEKQIGLKLNVSAEGWNEDTSTPIILQLMSIPEHDHVAYMTSDGREAASLSEFEEMAREAHDTDPDATFTYREEKHTSDHSVVDTSAIEPIFKDLKANEDQVIELAAGAYNLSLISPVNSDGSIYTVPAETGVEAAEITDDAEPIELVLVPADQVAPEQMQAIITALTVAHEVAPDAVSETIVSRATENAQACPNITPETIQETVDAAESVAQEAVQSGNAASAVQATKPTAQTPTANTGSAGGNAAASTPSGGNAASTPSTPSASTPAAPSAPAHTHNWVAQTTQKYVVDVKGTSHAICNQCGKSFGSVEAWGGHLTRGGSCVSHHVETTPEQGHYETVTTGYACSCGATK